MLARWVPGFQLDPNSLSIGIIGPDDSKQVCKLKARRRYWRSLGACCSARRPQPTPVPARRIPKSSAPPRPLLKVCPGYTILIVDINILLSSLSVAATLVDSNRQTIVNVVPLAVASKLDRISYLISAVPVHSTRKVQTAKGNYLRTLPV